MLDPALILGVIAALYTAFQYDLNVRIHRNTLAQQRNSARLVEIPDAIGTLLASKNPITQCVGCIHMLSLDWVSAENKQMYRELLETHKQELDDACDAATVAMLRLKLVLPREDFLGAAELHRRIRIMSQMLVNGEYVEVAQAHHEWAAAAGGYIEHLNVKLGLDVW